MKVLITPQVKQLINSSGNKTQKQSHLKIWAGLYKMSSRKNKHGYFDCPSTYLCSINARYTKTIKMLLDHKVIDFYKTSQPDPDNIFETKQKKYYDTKRGVCMKYKFLIDFSDAEWIEVEMDSGRKFNWYKITESSLKELGYEVKITRDVFGSRVHHPVIPVYKTDLKDKGFSVIDAVASQPRILYLIMKQRGIVDENYNEAFKTDFYDYVVQRLQLTNRKMAKDLFMYWLNSSGYVPNYMIHCLFPVASQFIKSLKTRNYKDSSSYLQREEAKIWIDDLLENLPVNFGLTIHDSLVVKDKDCFKVLEYCKSKYPEIDFKVEHL